jgi:hypothetical protein
MIFCMHITKLLHVTQTSPTRLFGYNFDQNIAYMNEITYESINI